MRNLEKLQLIADQDAVADQYSISAQDAVAYEDPAVKVGVVRHGMIIAKQYARVAKQGAVGN